MNTPLSSVSHHQYQQSPMQTNGGLKAVILIGGPHVGQYGR